MKIRHTFAAAAAALVLATTSAAYAAGPPYTVSVGGSSAPGAHAFTAATAGAVQMSFKSDAGTIINMNCVSITLSGTYTSGAGLDTVGSISSVNWNTCTMPGGAAAFSQAGTVGVRGTGGNATTGTETIAGLLSNFDFKLYTAANPAVCSFDISGSPRTTFDEGSQQLTISETGYTGNLRISNVSGCLGRWQNGNAMNLIAKFNLTSPDGAINLS